MGKKGEHLCGYRRWLCHYDLFLQSSGRDGRMGER